MGVPLSRQLLAGVLLGIVTSVMALPALAERVALVIGNSEYAANPLTNPVNDASDMAARLTEIGFRLHGDGPFIERGDEHRPHRRREPRASSDRRDGDADDQRAEAKALTAATAMSVHKITVAPRGRFTVDRGGWRPRRAHAATARSPKIAGIMN